MKLQFFVQNLKLICLFKQFFSDHSFNNTSLAGMIGLILCKVPETRVALVLNSQTFYSL